MGVGLGVAGLAFIAWGIVLGKQYIAEHHAIAKYRFENRTSGGVIQFKDYDASVTFRKREMRHNLLGKLLIGVLVTGVFCLVCAFLAFKN